MSQEAFAIWLPHHKTNRQPPSLDQLLVDRAHHLTIPTHNSIKAGTFTVFLEKAAHYLQMDREELLEALLED